jgi:pyruvate ferredoxin oxidoreductase delta subunit
VAVKLRGWKELAEGCVLETPGSSKEFKTGDWRINRPVWHEDKCTQCLFCWIYCPDTAVVVKDGKMAGFNYDFCKGCGICAAECPPKANAITMHPESEFRGGGK